MNPQYEDAVVVGISSEPSVVSVRLCGVAEGPDSLDAILRALGDAGVDLRSITRTRDQLALLVAAASLPALPAIVARLREAGTVADAAIGAEATPVSVVGSRLNARLAIAARMFRALSREGINSECLSTSEARIWCLVGDTDRQRALGALHEEFVEELAHLKEGQIGI
jgi:aspartate kinase